MSNSTNKRPPGDQEELVYADDRVIGRAFRGSFIALIVVVALGAVAWFVLRKKPEAKATQMTGITAPVAPSRSVPEVPAAKFTDVTAASGINFIHYSGAYGDK